MLLEIKSRSKTIKDISTDDFLSFSFTSDVIELIGRESGLNKNRIRLSIDGEGGKRIALEANKQLKAYGITSDASISVKDLGLQISWQLVFVIEYFGPILLHSLFFYGFREFFGFYQTTITQTLLYDLTLLHFTKREYETLRVHIFLNATMPFFNIFKNCFHYWILHGVLCSVFVYAPPLFSNSSNGLVRFLFRTSDWSLPAALAISAVIVIFEYFNYITHINLRNIRLQDPKNYQIPYGFGFDLVSCPNYLFEILSFVGFCVLSGNWAYVFFTIIGGGQMYIWAVGKHKRYLKTFGDKYKKLKRKVLIPFVL